jgi:prevent-host-death family protein
VSLDGLEFEFTNQYTIDIIKLRQPGLFEVKIASMEWQLQEAKNRLSQLVNQAAHDGPQIITVRGKPAAILLSIEELPRYREKSWIKITWCFGRTRSTCSRN